MDEFELWLDENKNQIDYKKLNKMHNRLRVRKLLNFKFKQDYKNCYKILFDSYKSTSVLKMLIIILTPLFILKKISWFHT